MQEVACRFVAPIARRRSEDGFRRKGGATVEVSRAFPFCFCFKKTLLSAQTILSDRQSRYPSTVFLKRFCLKCYRYCKLNPRDISHARILKFSFFLKNVTRWSFVF